jgi:thioredoxin reductase
VEYTLPPLEGVWSYAGHSIFHCPECDGYKARGKRVLVLGTGDGTAEMALRLKVWTDTITMCTNGEEPGMGPEAAGKLRAAGIRVETEMLRRLEGDPQTGAVAAAEAATRGLVCDVIFANLPCDPPTELYAQIGVKLHHGRWVLTDHRQRTNVPRCYAAGDIVAFAQTQLSVAMGQGATAGINLHLELLPEELRLRG